VNVGADPSVNRGRPPTLGKRAIRAPSEPTWVLAIACMHACIREGDATRETPAEVRRAHQPATREGQAGPIGVAGGPYYR
jgi:hypothetical protein